MSRLFKFIKFDHRHIIYSLMSSGKIFNNYIKYNIMLLRNPWIDLNFNHTTLYFLKLNFK